MTFFLNYCSFIYRNGRNHAAEAIWNAATGNQLPIMHSHYSLHVTDEANELASISKIRGIVLDVTITKCGHMIGYQI